MNEIIERIKQFKLEHPEVANAVNKESTIDNTTFNWPYIHSPFFTDIEISQLQNYYAESTDESYHDYFKEENNAIKNSDDRNTGKSWNNRIMELQNKLQFEQDPEIQDQIKQNLVDLGWNPEIEYTVESQAMARNRFIKLMTESRCSIDMIDISNTINSNSNIIFSESHGERLYPISIILIRGNSPVSGIITKFTNSDFTHSALALDGDFNKLYSFNFENNIRFGGGFSLESIKNYPKEGRLGIYTFFVNKNDYKKIEAKLQELLLNIKNTTYNIFNLILFPFKHISSEMSDSMICSQFVDSCMKMINIDLTNTKSSKVSPGMLYNKIVDNAKIYKTYDGIVGDFDTNVVSKFLYKLSKTAKAYNESINTNLLIYVIEARKIPIEITDRGDVLLTNPMPDFDAEYMVSHKLLMQYDKAKNYEGMKYELARLYYMNYILEKKLYHNSFLSNKEKNIKTRARVLNDFNKYIEILLKHDKDFNFSKYYEESIFYPNTVEIKGSTIKNILGYIL